MITLENGVPENVGAATLPAGVNATVAFVPAGVYEFMVSAGAEFVPAGVKAAVPLVPAGV